jgi:flagellar hook assembly protein FlgD
VKIYDMAGDLVTTLKSGVLMNAGDNLVGWNGTTEGGRTVANGVYLAHIEVTGVGGGNASTVVKIAVVQK